MPLIDVSYFIGELNIPNTDKPEISESLNRFIIKYEDKFLNDLLGYELYKEYKAGLLVDPIDAKWTDIRDGKEYTYSSRSYKWKGLRNATTKESLIANYVYYWYMRNQATETSGVGEVINKTENADRVSPAVKMARAWNEMTNEVWSLVSFLDASVSTYPSWSWNRDTSGTYWMSYNHARLRDIFYPINSMNL